MERKYLKCWKCGHEMKASKLEAHLSKPHKGEGSAPAPLAYRIDIKIGKSTELEVVDPSAKFYGDGEKCKFCDNPAIAGDAVCYGHHDG